MAELNRISAYFAPPAFETLPAISGVFERAKLKDKAFARWVRANLAQHRVPVSSLCIAAAVPATTALRWIRTMTDAGLFRRRADPHDGRRIFVELSPSASAAMRQYFAEAGEVAGF
jgi:DNA-binding MarR family transcriptional regulator